MFEGVSFAVGGALVFLLLQDIVDSNLITVKLRHRRRKISLQKQSRKRQCEK